jgi:OPT family oligopeptide transporter
MSAPASWSVAVPSAFISPVADGLRQFFFWIITPALYYSNTWYSQYMPISSRGSYDRTGNDYNVTQIINDDLTLNLAKYEAYSPLFLSTTFALSYGLSFASITATLMHALLYYRKQIWTQSRRALSEQPDIHARLMTRYPEVPELWYFTVFVLMFVFGVVSIEVYKTEFPVWAFVVALLIGRSVRCVGLRALNLSAAFFYIIPIGMIQVRGRHYYASYVLNQS